MRGESLGVMLVTTVTSATNTIHTRQQYQNWNTCCRTIGKKEPTLKKKQNVNWSKCHRSPNFSHLEKQKKKRQTDVKLYRIHLCLYRNRTLNLMVLFLIIIFLCFVTANIARKWPGRLTTVNAYIYIFCPSAYPMHCFRQVFRPLFSKFVFF